MIPHPPENAARGPNHRWRVGAYTFALYTLPGDPQRWRWECAAHGRGVGHHRTPWGAFIALRKWLKEPARPE